MPPRRPSVPDSRTPDKAPCGRPPKFKEPSRPVTVTLPESTLEQLGMIDPDRGRAIVKLASQAMQRGGAPPPAVEVVEMAQGSGLIIVGSSQILRRIPFLHLVEVSPGRFLLALDSGHDYHSLEIAIQDARDEMDGVSVREQELIQQLLEQIRQVRRSQRVTMVQILFVALDEARSSAAARTAVPLFAWLMGACA